jgi:nitrate reductase NapAB chaperone NapD
MNSLCISSLVVQTRPTLIDRVLKWINTIPEAEVYSKHEDDRLVVVLDAPDNRRAADRINDIQNQADVISATLIYQYRNEPDA